MAGAGERVLGWWRWFGEGSRFEGKGGGGGLGSRGCVRWLLGEEE